MKGMCTSSALKWCRERSVWKLKLVVRKVTTRLCRVRRDFVKGMFVSSTLKYRKSASLTLKWEQDLKSGPRNVRCLPARPALSERSDGFCEDLALWQKAWLKPADSQLLAFSYRAYPIQPVVRAASSFRIRAAVLPCSRGKPALLKRKEMKDKFCTWFVKPQGFFL